MQPSQYKQITLHDQILLRTDTYLGSVRREKKKTWTCMEGRNPKIAMEEVDLVPGFYQTFYEILSNAVDNVWRSRQLGKPCTYIHIVVVANTGECSVTNDGVTIPIQLYEGSDVYIPEKVFSNLLTSSNYDDQEKRFSSGRNGFGAKLTNIFSNHFEVVVCQFDKKVKQKIEYKQQWMDNMKTRGEPSIQRTPLEEAKGKQDSGLLGEFTQVRWTPDFAKLFMDDGFIAADMMRVLHRLAYDMAMVTHVPITWNGSSVEISSLVEYASLFYPKVVIPTEDIEVVDDEAAAAEFEKETVGNDKNREGDEDDAGGETLSNVKREEEVVEFKCLSFNKKHMYEIVLAPKNTLATTNATSFVNGVYTCDGGVHVDSAQLLLLKPLCTLINSKTKSSYKLTPKDMRQYFSLFVSCMLPNPEFDAQHKNRLSSPKPEFVAVDVKQVKQVLNWESTMAAIKADVDAKSTALLNKQVPKSKKVCQVEGMTHANLAGTSRAGETWAILCEGDSAKTHADRGIMLRGIYHEGAYIKGRDLIATMALRGKPKNVRNKKLEDIQASKVIMNIILALGLRYGLDYTIDANFATLNYGHLALCADSDNDGKHICGLALNLIHAMFPTLFERKQVFVYSLEAPLLRVKVGNEAKVRWFMGERSFKEWLGEQSDVVAARCKVKYHKGLATYEKEDLPATFGSRIVQYKVDDQTVNSFNKAFGVGRADERKDWISNYRYDDQDRSIEQVGHVEQSLTDFVEKFLVLYSIENCSRSLPHLIDGLKICQRKILFSAFKHNMASSLNNTLRVAQFSGFVSEHSNYHHGEQCLQNAIIKMAQDYPGSNNIPLFDPKGEFGSRDRSGKDSGAPRYIYLGMGHLTRLLFRQEDDSLLPCVNEDAHFVEPLHYVPILPLMLINGCTAGIATGWSSHVPPHDPLVVLQVVRHMISLNTDLPSDYDPNHPNAQHIAIPDNLNLIPWYRNIHGKITKVGTHKYSATGIMSTLPNGNLLVNDLPPEMSIEDFRKRLDSLWSQHKFKSFHDYSTVDSPCFVINVDKQRITPTVESLKMVTSISTSNMVMLKDGGYPTKYDDFQPILRMHFAARWNLYGTRKKFVIQAIENDLQALSNKMRFIKMYLDGNLLIAHIPKAQVVQQLKDSDFVETGTPPSFKYLLDLPLITITEERLVKLQTAIEELETRLRDYSSQTIAQLWSFELDEFETAYTKWRDDRTLELHQPPDSQTSSTSKSRLGAVGKVGKADGAGQRSKKKNIHPPPVSSHEKNDF